MYTLAYANVHRLSIAAVCLELAEMPSGNRLREVLADFLPDRPSLQRALNRMFRQQLHPSLLKGKRTFNIAIYRPAQNLQLAPDLRCVLILFCLTFIFVWLIMNKE